MQTKKKKKKKGKITRWIDDLHADTKDRSLILTQKKIQKTDPLDDLNLNLDYQIIKKK